MRRLLFKLHMTVGLVVGLLFVMSGLTGSLLVWGDEVDGLLNPQLLHVEPRPERATAESMLDAARQAYPQEKLARIRLPRAADESAEICFEAKKDARCVYVDPYSATVLGSRVPAQSFKGRVVSLHRRLLSGETGETIIGIGGLMLLTLSVSGLILWWPGRRLFSRALRLRRGASRYRRSLDLHKLVGISALLFLSISAATGAAMVFRPTFEKTLNRFSPQTPPADKPVSNVIEGRAPLSLDEILLQADASFPDAATTFVNLPMQPSAAFVVRKRQASEWHPSGRTLVYVDQYGGAILRVENPLQAPAGTRAANNLFPIHVGRMGGNFTRVLQAIVGFAPAFLFTTGFIMWLSRLKLRTRKRSLLQEEALEKA